MTINVWLNTDTNEYNIRYDGKHYVRHSYIAAKELIEDLLINLVAVAKHNSGTLAKDYDKDIRKAS